MYTNMTKLASAEATFDNTSGDHDVLSDRNTIPMLADMRLAGFYSICGNATGIFDIFDCTAAGPVLWT